MGQVAVVVKVSHAGKILDKPAFAFKRENGELVVDNNLITKMANQIGYHPRVVKVCISETFEEIDEAA